jgi:preprotein translocase subunit SecG
VLVAGLITLNIISGLFLIAVVLLQSGKGADMGAAFGGSSSTVFGASGAGNLLTKLTAGSAAVFMLTSLALAVVSSQQRSVFDDVSEPAPLSVPAAPGAASGSGEEKAADLGAAPAAQADAEQPAASDVAAPAAAAPEPAAENKDPGPADQALGAERAGSPANAAPAAGAKDAAGAAGAGGAEH